MINDTSGRPVETWHALRGVVLGLDRRFPNHNGPFERITRLTEEAGELAAAVAHAEGMGVKNDKHGAFDTENLVKEIQDVLRAAVGIARHYGVEQDLEDSIGHHYRRYQDMGYLTDDDIPAAPA
ncbi:MAG: MazG-like family protein [Micromonosporaceae bacterium]